MQTLGLGFTGVTPIMWHRDHIEFKSVIDRWQRDPSNRDKSVPGDDRSPAWGWIGGLYHDGKFLALPTDAVMASCMSAGAEVRAPRGKKSLKAQTQSGMAFTEPFMKFTVNGGHQIPMSMIEPLMHEEDFAVHMTAARDLGFALDIRRVRIGTSKHVRVRPVFEKWSASGTLNVWDSTLTPDIIKTVFYLAGDKYGLCEWRPSGKRPGPFGRFRAEVTEVK